MAVGIMEFRDGKVIRDRIYFGEPWEPAAWRAHCSNRLDAGVDHRVVPTGAFRNERYCAGVRCAA